MYGSTWYPAMMPATGLRRISVRSKRCLRNSGSWRSPNTGPGLAAEHGDFHAVEAEVVLAALVASALAHVVQVRLDVAAGDAGFVGDDERALDEPWLHRAEIVEIVLLLRVEEEEVHRPAQHGEHAGGIAPPHPPPPALEPGRLAVVLGELREVGALLHAGEAAPSRHAPRDEDGGVAEEGAHLDAARGRGGGGEAGQHAAF